MIKIVENPVVQVPLNAIIVSKANMRTVYDPETVESLARSIGRIGQIYPVLLHRIKDEKYELIVGSRRLKAARKAERPTISAVILDDISDPDMVILSLTENLHREDLTPFEQAKAILKLSKEHGLDPKEIAKRLNKPLPWVSGRLKILSVPESVQNLLCSNKVTLNHIGILASLGKPRDQIRYARIVAKQALSEKDLTTLIREEVKGIKPERQASIKLFTPMRTALKVKRFSKFLRDKVRPQLVLGGKEAVEVRRALREVRRTINGLLARDKVSQD